MSDDTTLLIVGSASLVVMYLAAVLHKRSLSRPAPTTSRPRPRHRERETGVTISSDGQGGIIFNFPPPPQGSQLTKEPKPAPYNLTDDQELLVQLWRDELNQLPETTSQEG